MRRFTTALSSRTLIGMVSVAIVVGIPSHKSLAQPGVQERVDFYGDPLPQGATARLGTTRLRHGDMISELYFSDDGRQLITRSGQTLRFWETKTGKLTRSIATGNMTMLRLKSDTFAVLPTMEGEFRFWRSRDSADIPLPPQPKSAFGDAQTDVAADDRTTLSNLVASPGGRVLATGAAGGRDQPRKVQLWRLIPGQRLKDLKPLAASWTTEGMIEWIGFAGDGSRVVMVSREAGDTDRSADEFDSAEGIRRVTIGTVADGKQVGPFSVPKLMANGTSRAITVSPNGQLLAIGAKAGDIILYDMNTAKELFRLPVKAPSVLVFSPDSKTLATGSRDEKVRIWNVESHELIHELSGHHSWVETLAFSPDGKMLASGGQDNMVHLWSPETGAEIVDLQGHAFWVLGASFSPNGKFALTSAGDATARVWNSQTGQSIRVHQAKHGQWVPSVIASPDGEHYAIAETGQLVVRKFSTGEIAWKYDDASIEKVTLASLSYSSDGRVLAATGLDGIVRIWNTGNAGDPVEVKYQRVAATIEDKTERLRLASVAVRPDGKQLALVTQSRNSASSVVEIWDLESQKMIRKITPKRGNGNHLVYSPDGKSLLMAGHSTRRGSIDGRDISSPRLDDSLILWDVATGDAVRRYDIGADNQQAWRGVTNAVFAKDGETIITTERNGVVRVYQTDDSSPTAEFKAHAGTPHALAVAHDGSGRFLTAGEDLVGMIWKLDLLGGVGTKR